MAAYGSGSIPSVMDGANSNKLGKNMKRLSIAQNYLKTLLVKCKFASKALVNDCNGTLKKTKLGIAKISVFILFQLMTIFSSVRVSSASSLSSSSSSSSTTTITTIKGNKANKKEASGKRQKHLAEIKIVASSHSESPSTLVTTAVTQKSDNKNPFNFRLKRDRNTELFYEIEEEAENSLRSLGKSLEGVKLDSLILLMVTSAVIPIFKRLGTSPILGFLLFGTIIGPTGFNWVRDVHLVDLLGEFGIVFFLFEIGLELSLEKLRAMRKFVFGLGSLQYLLTSAVGTFASVTLGVPLGGAVAIGGSLALSSSAFVLQLLKDKGAMATTQGKASFGILLLQDLAVVPLLVVIELLSRGGRGLGKALTIAGVKAIVTVSSMSILGRRVLDPIFYAVAKSNSREAFLSIILCTVLMMSFITKGIGLSDTLGAFLAGILLSETKFHRQIELDIEPFRGLLLGFFFITVGFNIDITLLINQFPKIMAILAAVISTKAAIIMSGCMLFGMPFSTAQLTGLLNSQVGEFAFVALGIARSSNMISADLCKTLLTVVALSMALTPALGEAGNYFMEKLAPSNIPSPTATIVEVETVNELTNTTVTEAVSVDSAVESKAQEIAEKVGIDEFVYICGFGRVGNMVASLLDKKFIKYIALDKNPEKADEANSRGLSVYYGDVDDPTLMASIASKNCKACVVAVDDMAGATKIVANIRQLFPSVPILVRAKNSEHQKELENVIDNVIAVSPVLPEDSLLFTLPFGSAVLNSLNVSRPEINAILDEYRSDLFQDDTIGNFLDSFYTRLPPTIAPVEMVPLTETEIAEAAIEKSERVN